VQRPVRLLFTF